jgi:predicted NBD/HSP70 family sugar kinase
VAAHREMAWVGIDVGKTQHWVCVVDADGKVLLSVKIGNDEAETVALLAQVALLATRLIWRCCWHCWLAPASRCVTRRGEWSPR